MAEDDPSVRSTLRWVLEDEGLPVETAADGVEALGLALERAPAVAVLDMHLPSLDGCALAAQLRERIDPDLPILIITADAGGEEEARQVGALVCLHKPFEVDAFLVAIRRARRRRPAAASVR